VSDVRSAGEFALAFDGGLRWVRTADAADITARYREVVSGRSIADGALSFPEAGWEAVFLGSGEEKAVYCLRDPRGVVTALELIDERGYLGGRLVDGTYFAELRVSGVRTGTADPGSFALQFTGLVKVREFVHGYEWARFRFDPRRPSPVDLLITAWLRLFLIPAMDRYRARYGDVDECNVLFEQHDEWQVAGRRYISESSMTQLTTPAAPLATGQLLTAS